MPEGDEYVLVRNAAEVLERVRAEVAQWPEEELRKDANPGLSVMENIAHSGQQDVFFVTRLLGRLPETTARLVALLRR